MFTRTCHWSQYCMRWKYFTPGTLLKNHFNIFWSMLMPSKWLVGFPTKIFISCHSCMYYMSHASHPPSIYYPNIIWWVQIMQLLIVQFFLNILFLNTLNLCSALNVRDYSYKGCCLVWIHIVLVCTFWWENTCASTLPSSRSFPILAINGAEQVIIETRVINSYAVFTKLFKYESIQQSILLFEHSVSKFTSTFVPTHL